MYFLNLFIIPFNSCSLPANKTISSAYVIDYTFFFSITTPVCSFLISSSRSEICTLNNVGLIGHPCLISFSVQNSSDFSFSTFTLYFISLYVSIILSLNCSVTPILSNISLNIFLSTLSNVAFKSGKNTNIFPFFFVISLFTT